MGKKLRILDFDLENRPLSYLGQDFTTSDITVVAWAWTDKPDEVIFQAQGPGTTIDYGPFLKAWHEADIVTGHYVLGHDIPILNGALMERGAEPLQPKMVSDTKVHLINRKGISASQESISTMYGTIYQKPNLTQTDWRSANRLEPDGIRIAIDRCVSDVRQHMEMRAILVEMGWLKAPTYYQGAGKIEGYTP